MSSSYVSSSVAFKSMKAAIAARMPVVLVGDPGSGKTAMVRSLVDELDDYELITLIGSQLDPTDITGMPKSATVMYDDNGNPIEGTVYSAPWWQVRILQHKKVFLFLDEWSNTPGAVRASMLTLLQNREFPNGTRMPDETIVIGAMNPTEQAADGYQMDTPTSNRMFFIPWSPTVASWKEGMLDAWGDDDVSEEERLWKAKIVGFIDDNPTWLHKMPQDVNSTEAYGVNQNDASEVEILSLAWASRRSWDNLSRVLAGTPDDSVIQDFIAQGIVGRGASSAFREWLRKNDTIDPKKALEKPESINWKAMKLDESNLVMRAVMASIPDEETFTKVLNLFNQIAVQGRTDIGGPYMLDVIKTKSKVKLSPDTLKELNNLVRVYTVSGSVPKSSPATTSK